MGLTVVAVENGRDAAQATLDEQFDLILLDIQMPIMDGEQAISIMQATGVTTPIVALTANTMKHEVDRYLRQGFTTILPNLSIDGVLAVKSQVTLILIYAKILSCLMMSLHYSSKNTLKD